MKDGASKAPLGKCTEGGWEDYTRQIRSLVAGNILDKPLTEKQYSHMMQMYITRVSVEDAAERLMKGEKK